MKNNCLTLVLLLIFFKTSFIISQEKTFEYNIENGLEITYWENMDNGNFFFLENSKTETKFTLLSENLSIIQQFNDDEISKKASLSYFSNTGHNYILEEKDNYFLINNEKTNFGYDDIDDDISDTFFYN